jgi:methylenetetrahydrofolate reductase (NADPH)
VKILPLLNAGHRGHSYEFSPPRDELGIQSLFENLRALRAHEPAFVSVTYGAGGSTRERTASLVTRMIREEGVEAMAHLTCVGSTELELGKLCDELARGGVENVLALRGDPPRGADTFHVTGGGFRYAKDLVRFLRKNFDFCIGAACYPEPHPEAESQSVAISHLLEKVEAGVDFLVTQLFFRASDYEHFAAAARGAGIAAPILAGIFPPTDLGAVLRMTRKCGASVPSEMVRALEMEAEDGGERFGIDASARLCRELLELGVDGLHFYTRNRAQDSLAVLDALGSEWRRPGSYVRTCTAQGAKRRARTV